MEQKKPSLSKDQVNAMIERIKSGEKPSLRDQDEAVGRQRQAAEKAKQEVEKTINKSLKDRGIGPRDKQITIGGQEVDTSKVPGSSANLEWNKE
ncbi:hypothetical protein [Candidatus Chazhemtobacterium aquaticus]|uniref:Uncharacterized protein n=1 Tax=Candidatus Chazhemtobacterium aquaticus TaxID=2715735 RepID=A0A857N6I2_9BACT|nr:hypothetical protein [Candidatus Chazhemtobacterium aquaticus]QHO63787.1 hypothetical protein MICH65_0806 [Candidatus Chazhemtobacterium aquaticus]